MYDAWAIINKLKPLIGVKVYFNSAFGSANNHVGKLISIDNGMLEIEGWRHYIDIHNADHTADNITVDWASSIAGKITVVRGGSAKGCRISD